MLILLCLMAHTAVHAQASTPPFIRCDRFHPPNADGSIYHYVVYGDTLWNIAEATVSLPPAIS